MCKYGKCYPWIIIGIDVTELIISSDSYVGRAKRNFTLLADQTVCHASSTSLLNLNCYLTIAPTGIPVTRLPSPPGRYSGQQLNRSLSTFGTKLEKRSIRFLSQETLHSVFHSEWMDGWKSISRNKGGYNPPPLVKPSLESSRKKGEGRGERR